MEFLITFFIALSLFFLLSKRFSAEDRRRVAPEVVRSSSSVNNDNLEKVGEVSRQLETSKEIEIEDCVVEGNEKVEISRSSEAEADDGDPSKKIDLVESVNDDDDATLLQDYEDNELEGVENMEFELEEDGKEQNISEINEVQLVIDSSVDAPLIRDYEVNELHGVDNSDYELEKEKKEHNFCETSELEGVDNVEFDLEDKENKEQSMYETSEFRLKVDSSVESWRQVEIVVDEATLIMVKENPNDSISNVSNIENLSAMQVFDDNSLEQDKSNEVLGEIHSQILMVEIMENDGYLLKEEVKFQVSENKTDQGSQIERGSCNSVTVNEFPAEDLITLGPLSQDMLESEVDDEDEWEGIERSGVEARFGVANAYIGSEIGANALSKLSGDVRMQLYGLHKIATEGPCYEPQPMVLKVSARAKWQSWQRLGNMDQEAAMEQYMTLLSQNIPGWMGDRP